jgi:ribosome maturation factor RimP
VDNLQHRLEEIVLPVLQNHGVDFIETQIKGGRNSQIVRIIVDADGGISLDRCAAISRDLAAHLDVADVFPGRYRLEVSSPGTDRPLKTLRDFERNIGRQVKVQYRQGEAIDTLEGTVKGVTDHEVEVANAQVSHFIPLQAIEAAKIQLAW